MRETIFTDLLADSVAVDDEEAAEEAPVDGGDVPLVCSEANANAIWKPAYKLHIKRLLVNWIQIFVICSAD